jgi:hypothetical protein
MNSAEGKFGGVSTISTTTRTLPVLTGSASSSFNVRSLATEPVTISAFRVMTFPRSG